MIILGYLVISLTLVYFFFLFQFPYDQLKRTIIRGFEETLPLRLSIATVRASFPSDLLIEDINIESGTFLFEVPDLSLQPNFPGFFWGRRSYNLKDLGNRQSLSGEFQSEKDQHRIKIRLHGLEIKASSQKEISFPMKVSGEAMFEWMGDDFEKGNGQVWALLERGEIRGTRDSPIPLPLTLFERIRAEIQFREGLLRIKRLEVSGKEMKGSFQGDFQFSKKGDFFDLSLLWQPPGGGREAQGVRR